MGVEIAAEKTSIGGIKAMNGGDKAYINNSLDGLEKKASLSQFEKKIIKIYKALRLMEK